MKKIMNGKIRSFFIKVLKDSDLLLSIYNTYYKLLNKKRFLKEIEKRKSLSIFDYKKLSDDLPYCPFEKIKDSNFYGQAYALQRYAEVKSVDYAIEHGLYFDNYVPKASYLRTTKRILTMSDVRKNVLSKELNKQVLTVGPYIHYAQSLLSEPELLLLKKELGKILLFFPTHTCKEGGQTYDISHTIFQVKRIAKEKQCDTIIVCMYYRDILTSKYADNYEAAGIKVVTAGHQLDLYFLPRLKSIISLSDYTVSNNVGTHIGYCIYLGKPHYIYEKDLVVEVPLEQFNEIGSVFFEKSDIITDNQYNIVSKYWGFEFIKSKEELKKYFTE